MWRDLSLYGKFTKHASPIQVATWWNTECKHALEQWRECRSKANYRQMVKAFNAACKAAKASCGSDKVQQL